MTTDPLPTDEVERRRPVWLALSALWLDTELDDGDLRHIADVLRASGYGLPALRDIYLFEVAPVVGGNLHAPAGVWEGFDPDWLHERVRAGVPAGRWTRWWARSPLGRWYLTHATAGPWARIEALLAAPGPDEPRHAGRPA